MDNTGRMLRRACQNVDREWGANTRQRLGPRLYQALLHEQVLLLCYSQDEEVSDANVRRILNRGCEWVIQEVQGEPHPE